MQELEYLQIVKINQQNLTDINKANQPFEIIGKIKPTFAGEKWTYTEEIYEHPYIKEYPSDSQRIYRVPMKLGERLVQKAVYFYALAGLLYQRAP